MRQGRTRGSLIPLVLMLAGVGALLKPCPVHADDVQLIEDEFEETLLRLMDMGAFDHWPRNRPLVIKRPSRVRYELGAVIGISSKDPTYPIVAITPDGRADRMGLRLGDKVRKVNGVVLADSKDPSQDLSAAVSRDAGVVRLEVTRDGELLSFTGAAEAIEVPAYQLRIDRPLRGVMKEAIPFPGN